MLLAAVCRTCNVQKVKNINLHALISKVEKCKETTLADLLLELAKIDVNVAQNSKLPQHMCSNCLRKLKSAYAFVVQARQVNDKLMLCLQQHAPESVSLLKKERENDNAVKFYAEDLVEVKMEITEEKPHFGLPKALLLHVNKLPSSDEDEVYASEDNQDPLVTIDTCENATHQESSSYDEVDELPLQQCKLLLTEHPKRIVSKTTSLKTYACNDCGKVYTRPKSLELHKLKHRAKSDWHNCNLCERKFYRADLLRNHLKVHGEQSKKKRSVNICERKQAKSIDINLCKPNGCKIIQCMICLRKYAKFNELRSHMQNHPKIVTFAERTESLQELADAFYPELKKPTEDQLLTNINRDLIAGNFIQFYSITNESGYELSLDSSETESENEIETMESTRANTLYTYSCELCEASYQRKYQLYEHQRTQHVWQDAPYECRRCNARFLSKKLLDHHHERLCRNIANRFICPKCPLRFRWRHNLKAHTRTHRNKTQTAECMVCQRIFEDKRSLTIHQRLVHADKANILPCLWCSRKFYSRHYLLKHLQRHGLRERDVPLAETLVAATANPHGKKKIVCRVCNQQFMRIAELRVHMAMELKLGLTTQQNYSMSNYSIINAAGYELHIDDSETEDENDEDDVVGKSTALKMLNSGNTYSCDICQIKCRRKFKLFQHQHSLHSFDKLPHACGNCIFKSVSKELLAHHERTQCLNTEKSAVCLICGYKFMWPENLEMHVRLQHTNANEQTSGTFVQRKPKTSSANPAEPLRCPHCERTYLQQARLNMHIKDVHTDTDRKKKDRYLCSLCGQAAQSNSKLIIHMRRHTGERPFKCDLCEMAFTARNEMVLHRRLHTGERPFVCSICGKGFPRSEKLKIHMLMHSGLRPHKCSYCDMDFRYKHDLKLHLKKHTGQLNLSLQIEAQSL